MGNDAWLWVTQAPCCTGAAPALAWGNILDPRPAMDGRSSPAATLLLNVLAHAGLDRLAAADLEPIAERPSQYRCRWDISYGRLAMLEAAAMADGGTLGDRLCLHPNHLVQFGQDQAQRGEARRTWFAVLLVDAAASMRGLNYLVYRRRRRPAQLRVHGPLELLGSAREGGGPWWTLVRFEARGGDLGLHAVGACCCPALERGIPLALPGWGTRLLAGWLIGYLARVRGLTADTGDARGPTQLTLLHPFAGEGADASGQYFMVERAGHGCAVLGAAPRGAGAIGVSIANGGCAGLRSALDAALLGMPADQH